MRRLRSVQTCVTGETSYAARNKMLPYKSPVPRTKLTKTLLTDNVNDERKLQVYLERLLRDRRKQSAKMRQQLTAFENHQDSKKRLWSRRDELQLSRLNLPQIQLGKTTLKSVTLEEIYRKPKNLKTAEFTVPLLPVMVGEDMQKIVEYNKQIFITRLPTVERLTTRQMRRYNGYKGSRLLEDKKALQDKRFKRLSDALSERKSATEIKSSKPFFMTRSLTYM
ncbi:hypothetical protein EB796_000930 [Bugula neritina]|uniref:Uncharacterized protein n=1 Tax=Bugula neritina TaxID=10212 RepID=A0A7J7KRD9_BUGNE|nr:hypothetical protein EB796_000930 [Bugula neritina]